MCGSTDFDGQNLGSIGPAIPYYFGIQNNRYFPFCRLFVKRTERVALTRPHLAYLQVM